MVPNLCSPACFENQRVKRSIAKKSKKSVFIVWRICCKAVILHPLSREKRGTVEMLKRNRVLNLPLQKTFFEKKTSKSFGSSKIVLTFASAFEKEALKKSSLKDLDMNKQVVQDYLY